MTGSNHPIQSFAFLHLSLFFCVQPQGIHGGTNDVSHCQQERAYTEYLRGVLRQPG
jgi:hypothetical protein